MVRAGSDRGSGSIDDRILVTGSFILLISWRRARDSNLVPGPWLAAAQLSIAAEELQFSYFQNATPMTELSCKAGRLGPLSDGRFFRLASAEIGGVREMD